MVPNSFKSPLSICLLILFAYIMGLWSISVPLTGDQKVYLSIALEMFEKKQWIIPSLFGDPNFLKPPFQYWATLMGWNVFGLSIFGALLPSVLALVGSAGICFQIGKKLKLDRPDIAAILFASTLGSMTYGSTAQMEIWIVFFFLSAWWAVLLSRIFLAFLLVGIMAWVKGPLYPILWTMSFLVWNLSSLKSKKFWFALTFGVAVGLAWYALAARTHYQEMMRQFFYTENLGKLSTPQGSILSLWTEFLFSLFPWGVIFFVGCFQKNTREKWKENQKFYLSYSLLSIAFFTFFPYRVNSYFYFLTPIIAMLASEADLSLSRKWSFILKSIFSVFFIFAIFLLYRLVMGEWIGPEIFLSFLFVFFVFMIGLFKDRWMTLALASLLMVNLIRVSAVQIGERDIAGLKNTLQVMPQEYAFFIESKDIWHEYGLLSSAIGRPIRRIYDKSALDSFLALGGVLILQEEQKIENSNLQCIDWLRLKRRKKFPLQKFLSEGIAWGDPEITRNYHICKAH